MPTKGGPIDSCRWTRTAARTLRQYMSTVAPCTAMKKLVRYIVQVYTPVWVAIKTSPRCIAESKHLFSLLLY